jgi:glycosyltransferase involved in cell wall biosynthesis
VKIVLLSAASSIHTVRWANGLVEAGNEVHVISQHPLVENIDSRVHFHLLPFHGLLGYFLMVPKVNKLLKKIQPDIVNAHYASGYGTTARLTNYHPCLLSVWGSDVYDFPFQSFIHKYLVRKNLLAADAVASTSVCMADQTRLFTPELNDIPITPFGVDTKYYDSLTTPLSDRNLKKNIVIGTVKTLAPTYGIDTLIQAFSLLVNQLSLTFPDIESRLTLRLVGAGPQENELKKLTCDLGVINRVEFVGRVDSNDVPRELDKFDIYVALSREESFGVAIIEAGAAGRPVVVSDAGGLPEVVIDGETGFVVPREDAQAAADAIEQLVLDNALRIKMGDAGKQHVVNTYDWDSCVKIMMDLYKETIAKHKAK